MRGMVVSCVPMTGVAVTGMIVSVLGRPMAMPGMATCGAFMRDGRLGCVLFDHWLLLAFRLHAVRLARLPAA